MRIETQKNFGRRECPACACEVAANNNRCPICGYVFPVKTPTQMFMRIGGALIMLTLLVWMLLRLSL